MTDTPEDLWKDLGAEAGVPILPIVCSIGGVLVFALIIGIICRCCYLRRKKANKIKDGDFSVSEEETRAGIVKANVLKDIENRERSLSQSRSSLPG